MKKKTGIVAVTAALCALTMSMGIFAACAPEDVKDYTFTEPQITRPAPDEGITIDGVLDEQAYTSRRWIRGVKLVTQNPGDDTSIGKDYDAVVRRLENAATVEMTAVIGEKGIYIGVHVDEGEGIVYMNSDRASFMNSCAELYFALPGNDDIKNTGSLEIDVMPDGTMRLKKNYATGNWDDFPATYDKASYSAATTDGTINIDAHSYTVEVFLTYEHLDLVQPGASAAIKEEGEIRLNIAPITSYSIDGTTESDRWWWMLGSQLDDGAWGNTDGWYHFDENGLMSYDITIADDIEHGSVMEWVDYDWAAANNSVTFLAKADDGYALTDLTVNGTSYKDNIEYQNTAMTKAAVTIPASVVKENLSVDATFTEFGTEPMQFEASVKGRKVGQDVQFANGTKVAFEGVINYEFTVTDGKISGEVVPGLYDISISGDGLENYSGLTQVSVLPNQALSLTFPYSVFGQYPGTEGTVGNTYANEDDSRVTLVSGEAFPVTTDSYGDSAFTATFMLSQAEQNNGHGLRYIFDDGVAVQPYVKWGNGAHEGKFIVEWVGTANWGTDSAAGGGNWATVDLPDSFGTAFDDGTGVDLTIVRDGRDFYVFVSIHGQPETRVLSHKLTVDEKYAEQEGRYGIAVWDQRVGAEIPFDVTEDAQELSALLKLNVTVNQPENGKLTVQDQDSLTVNDELVITVEPQDGYIVRYLKVNGEEVVVTNGEYRLEKTDLVAFAVNYVVEAAFEAAQSVNVTFDVTPVQRLGKSDDLSGRTLVFQSSSMSFEAVVKDGTVEAELYAGLEYTVTVKDAAAFGSVTYQAAVGTTEAALTFSGYDAFSNTLIGSGTAIDKTHQNEENGYIVKSGTGALWAATNEAFGDSAFTVTFSASDRTEDFVVAAYAFEMNGTKRVLAVQLDISGNALKVQWRPTWLGSIGFEDSEVINTSWDGLLYEDLSDAFNGSGIDLTLVRSGLTIYVLVNAHGDDDVYYMESYTLDGQFENVKGHWAMGGSNVKDGAQIEFRLTEGAAAEQLIKLPVTVQAGEGGTVTVTNKDSLIVGEAVEIAVKADESYMITSVKVNGEPVQLTDGKYTLTFPQGADPNNLKVYGILAKVTVEVTFERAAAEEVTFNVSSVQRFGTSADLNGKTLVFAGAGESKTAVVTEGKVTVQLYEGVDYTVAVQDESYFGSVTVTSETKDAIAFTYDAFTENLFGSGGGPLDDSKANGAETSVTNVNAGTMWASTKETFGDSAFTITIQKSDFTKDYFVLAFIFDDGKYVMASLTEKDRNVRAEWRGLWVGFGLDDQANLKYGNWDGASCEQFNDVFAGEGVDLTVVRSGNSFYMFLSAHGDTESAVLANMFTVDEKYQTTEGHWSIGAGSAAANATFEFVLAEGADAVEEWTELLYFYAEATAQDENGQVELSAGKALRDGGSITVTVTANTGYAVDKLLVNGEDRAAELSDGKLTLTAADCPDGSRKIVVSVTFKEATEVSVTAEVSALRFGKAVDLESAEVLLSGSKNATLTITGGKMTGMAVPGTYTATLVGMSYNSISVTIANDGTVSANDGNKLAFTYDMFKVNVGAMDDSHENDENAYLVNGAAGDLWAISNDTFGDSAMTVTLQESDFTGEYAPIGYIFDDNKLVMATFKKALRAEWRDDFLPFNLDKNVLLHSSGWNGADFPALSEAFAGDGIDFTLVRDGLHFYIFVSAHGSNEKFLATQITISDAYASQQGHWAIGALTAAQDAQIDFVLVEDAEAVEDLVKLDVTVQTATNGSVTVENKDALTVGDEVKITVTPEEGYRLDELTVNGSVVTPSGDAAAYSYTYRLPNGVKPEVTVEATFFASEEVSAAVTVSPVQRLGASADLNGKTLVFVGDYGRLTHEAAVADGKVTVSLYTGVDYTVTVKDEPYYGSQSMTGAASAAVSFTYDAFTANLIGNNEGTAIDDSNANTDTYITATDGGRFWAVMNEGSLDSVFTATFSAKTSTNSDAFRTVVYTFEDKAAVIPIVKKDNGDQIKVEWQGWAEFGLTNMLNNVWNTKRHGGALYEAYNGDGIDFIVVRSGRTIYVFLSEADKPETAVFFDSYTFDEKYEGVAGHFGIGVGSDVPAGSRLYFDYSEDAEEVAAWVAKASAQ